MWLHFSPAGFAVQYVRIPPDTEHPERRIRMKLWYSIESATTVRLRPKPGHKGWTRECVLDDAKLTMTLEESQWVFTKAAPEEVPDWFTQALAKEV